MNYLKKRMTEKIKLFDPLIGDSEKNAINKVLDDFSNGYREGDLTKVMAVFSEDAVMLEGRGLNNGKKEIHDDHLAGEFKNLDFPVFEPRDRVIKGSGEMAFAFEMLKVQLKRKGEEPTRDPRDSRVSYVLKKIDNNWKITLIHF